MDRADRVPRIDPPQQGASPPEAFGRQGLVVILIAAALLRFWRLGAQSLWIEEGSTWTAASGPLGRLLELCARREASPPLFYLLTSLVIKLGHSEAHLRLVSALASVGLVWATYRIARLAFERQTATLAAALAALSPFQLMFAQEARAHSLVAFLATLALYLFARAVLADRRRAWVPFVLVSALALWTRGVAWLGVGVQGALALFTAPGRRRLLQWLGSQGAALALYLPWLVIRSAQGSHLPSADGPLAQPGGPSIPDMLRAVFLSPLPLTGAPPLAARPGWAQGLPGVLTHLALLAALVAPLLLGLARARDSGSSRLILRLAACGLSLPLVAARAVSHQVPLWLPGSFVLVTPMLAVLLAAGLSSLRPRPLAMSWTALLLLISGYGDFRYFIDYTKERWRDVAQSITSRSPAGRTAVLVTFDAGSFRYYTSALDPAPAVYEVSHPDAPGGFSYTAQQLQEMERAARDSTARFEEVWVVDRSSDSAVRREVAERSRRAAAKGREPLSRERWEAFQGTLRVSRFRALPGDTLRRQAMR